jgi:hypothetical protein
MFGFFSSTRSCVFEERRKKQEVWRTMRRVIDLYSVREALRGVDKRQYSRRPVSMPVLVQVFGSSYPYEPFIGVTKNFSDDGLALLCKKEIAASETAFCCVWGNQPNCFIGVTRQARYAGGGFWETGVAFQEMAYLSDWGSLRLLAMSLNPEQEQGSERD